MTVACRNFFGLLLVVLAVSSSEAKSPNILVVLADDMGYGDLGCMGSQHLSTAQIDALAASGVLCTQAYVASPVCSPSRAGLMTGRDPRRFGYEGNLNQAPPITRRGRNCWACRRGNIRLAITCELPGMRPR